MYSLSTFRPLEGRATVSSVAALLLATTQLLGQLLAGVPVASATPATSNIPAQAESEPARDERLRAAFGKLPLSFEPGLDAAVDAKRGQASPGYRFVARAAGQTLYLRDTEILVVAGDGENGSRVVQRLRVEGAAPRAITGEELLPGRAHYLVGNDPSRWRRDVPTFARVRYDEILPGVDLLVRGTRTEPEYDFVVAPGADPSSIALLFDDAKGLRIDVNGDLVIPTEGGEARHRRPVLYQEVDGERRLIEGSFRIEGARVRFTVGAYDPALPLVIDPVLQYSTFLGASLEDDVSSVAVDASGNAYVCGGTNSTGFPTQNPFQGNSLLRDGFVAKLNASGTGLIYSTYLGAAAIDLCNSITVDSRGRAFVTGFTTSRFFPTRNAYQGTKVVDLGDDGDAFLTVLNSGGSDVDYSTYFGGRSDDTGFAIAVDVNGNAFITGRTKPLVFPTKSPSALPPFQKEPGGGIFGSDAFVAKFDPDEEGETSLVYSTLLGGSATDEGFGIAVDEFERAYVCGFTVSEDFPVVAPIQNRSAGGADAFITKFNADGTAVFYSTYFGGSGTDDAFGIALDAAAGNEVLVCGQTASTDLPAINAFQAAPGGSLDAFVLRLDADGTQILFSSYLGGEGFDRPHNIAVDGDGTAYLTGEADEGFPLVREIPIFGATPTSGVFLAQVDRSGELLVSTCIGPGVGLGIAVDAFGDIYIGGSTESPSFPITPGAFQPIDGGRGDGFVLKFDTLDDDTIGVFQLVSREFRLRNANTAGPPDIVALFGTTDTIPIAGDWDGDGVDTIGSYSTTTGTFRLRNSNTAGLADITFVFGAPNLLPIAGDWDGDGIDTIGVFDPSTSTFFLKNTNAGGNADLAFAFGLPGQNARPVAGDWNGDGVDTIGIFVPVGRLFFLNNANVGGNADITLTFNPGAMTLPEPVAGDWDGNGADTIGLFGRVSALQQKFFLRNSNTTGPADRIVAFGANGDRPVTGNWDGV